MTFTKHDKDKPRYSLVPPNALSSTIAVLEHGARKYGDHNWRQCPDPIRYWDAAQRHLWAYHAGETHDTESGLHHLSHAICSLMFVYELTHTETE